MFWEVLLGSRLGFRWWSPGSLVFYPVVLIGELLGPAPTSPERPYEKAWTAFDYATLHGNRMEYTLAVQSGEIFAVHADVENTLAIGQDILLGLFATGPVLLPAA